MEKEKMKRPRERDNDDTEIRCSENNNNNAKKRDIYGINLKKEKQQKKDLEAEKGYSWDSHLPLGVFDFPWLKDGVMSKSEDYLLDFEDKFSSSLQHEDAAFNAAGIDFSEAYCYCETPEASKMVETVWQPFESDGLEIKAEDVDCIWSSLLNKTLSQEEEEQQQQHEGSL